MKSSTPTLLLSVFSTFEVGGPQVRFSTIVAATVAGDARPVCGGRGADGAAVAPSESRQMAKASERILMGTSTPAGDESGG